MLHRLFYICVACVSKIIYIDIFPAIHCYVLIISTMLQIIHNRNEKNAMLCSVIPKGRSLSSVVTPAAPNVNIVNRNGQSFHKTELCQSVHDGQKCSYGTACNFAHSKCELRLKTFAERHKYAQEYRTLPCLDHVSTGHWYVSSTKW